MLNKDVIKQIIDWSYPHIAMEHINRSSGDGMHENQHFLYTYLQWLHNSFDKYFALGKQLQEKY